MSIEEENYTGKANAVLYKETLSSKAWLTGKAMKKEEEEASCELRRKL